MISGSCAGKAIESWLNCPTFRATQNGSVSLTFLCYTERNINALIFLPLSLHPFSLYRDKFSKHRGKEREGAIERETDALQSQVTDGLKILWRICCFDTYITRGCTVRSVQTPSEASLSLPPSFSLSNFSLGHHHCLRIIPFKMHWFTFWSVEH